MPRQPRLDAPGTLHHVMDHGIDRTKIFKNKADRVNFLEGIRIPSDERVLGSGAFIEELLAEVDEREKETIRLSRKISDLALLAEDVAKEIGISLAVLRSGSRNRNVSKARKLLCQLAVKKMGYPGAEVARFLGVTTSAVNRTARAEEVPDLNRYL